MAVRGYHTIAHLRSIALGTALGDRSTLPLSDAAWRGTSPLKGMQASVLLS